MAANHLTDRVGLCGVESESFPHGAPKDCGDGLTSRHRGPVAHSWTSPGCDVSAAGRAQDRQCLKDQEAGSVLGCGVGLVMVHGPCSDKREMAADVRIGQLSPSCATPNEVRQRGRHVMRIPVVCQNCRTRHQKCTRLPDSDSCQRCRDTGQTCVPSVAWSFHTVTAVTERSSSGGRQKRSLAFDKSQRWIRLPSEVSFVTPNSDLELDPPLSEPSLEETLSLPTPKASHGNLSYRPDYQPADLLGPSLVAPDGPDPIAAPSEDGLVEDIAALTDLLNAHQRDYFALHDDATSSNIDSPFYSYDSQTSPSWLRPRSATTTADATSSWSLSSAEEARLLHHYIVHVTPWVDICDTQKHFGTEIPKRASHLPVLKNAILALATRHTAIAAGQADTGSAKYVSRCLQVIISALNDPMGHWDENLLAAMVILRLHEEMNRDEDHRLHLSGATKLLNSISSFASDGGLREAASWASLRQHIYIALTTQQPLMIKLENYKYSASFISDDDEAWTNRIIYVFALILYECLRQDEVITSEKIANLDIQVENWNLAKPWYYSLLFKQEVKEDWQDDWDELYLVGPPQVVGLQYYHLCKMTLAIFDPETSGGGFKRMQTQRKLEACVRRHLHTIISLALSNKHVDNAQFQVSHGMMAFGSYVHDPTQQEAALEALKDIERRTGWNTTFVIDSLMHQWGRE